MTLHILPRRADARRVETLRLREFPSRALVVAATAKMPYRVIQCLTDAGVATYGLGSGIAGGLRHSRRLAGFSRLPTPVDGTAPAPLVAEVNAAIARWGIDVVVPGDAQGTRSLIAMRDRLAAPCFPMPDLRLFDRLNDKWEFYNLCRTLGVEVPASWVFASVEALTAAHRAGAFVRETIAKPLSLTGGEGCVRIDPRHPADGLAKIDYAPILVQDYIEGEDIGASALCERGKVRAFIAHRYGRNVYQTFHDPRVLKVVEAIAAAVRYDGVCNFDMRLAADGRIYYLECNPRIYFKMMMSKLAGVDFVGMALGRKEKREPVLGAPTKVRLPKALLLSLWAPWRIEPQSWRALRMTLADPIPYLREEFGLDEDLRKD